MSEESLVSIIVPVFDAESTIGRCVESIIKQSYLNIEIVLVNDGSTDKTGAIIGRIAKKDGRIVVVSKENGGVSSSRNIGLEKARGKYVVFCDADDYVDSELIKQLLVSNKKGELSGAKIIKQNGTHSKEDCNREYHVRSEYLGNIFKGNEVGFVNGFLFEKKKIGNLKFDTNTSYMEDTLFLIRYIKKNKIKSVHHVNKKSNYYHVCSPTSLTRKNNKKRVYGYFHSLNKINEILDYDYSKLIENDKIRILENEFVRSEDRIVDDNLIIKKYYGLSIRYKLFSFLYRNNSNFALKKYARIIDTIHSIKKIKG